MINLGSYPGGRSGLPKVHYRPMLLDRVLELAALLLLFGQWACAYYIYKVYGASAELSPWVLVGRGVLVWLLLVWASYASSARYNFPVKVTERNIVVQYVLAVRMTRVVNVVLGCVLIGEALMRYQRWAAWLFTGGLVVLLMVLAVYFVMAFRRK